MSHSSFKSWKSVAKHLRLYNSIDWVSPHYLRLRCFFVLRKYNVATTCIFFKQHYPLSFEKKRIHFKLICQIGCDLLQCITCSDKAYKSLLIAWDL